MLSLCLRLFVRWLDKYSPEAADFPPTGGPSEINPPPGFHILLQLHTNSDLLRLLFHTLDETVNLLERRPLPAKVGLTLNSAIFDWLTFVLLRSFGSYRDV